VKTVSESAFESFLIKNSLPFEPIQQSDAPRPDYVVQVADLQIIFEVKELASDEDFREVKEPHSPLLRAHSRFIGDHVRAKISAAKKQIQYSAKHGLTCRDVGQSTSSFSFAQTTVSRAYSATIS
jgi:hypothetical protein